MTASASHNHNHPKFHPLISSALINLAAALFFALAMYPIFETNDDTAMARLTDGSLILSDPHIVFSSALLGRIYQFCYSLTSRLPWYPMLQYALLAAAFTAITWWLMAHLPRRNWTPVWALILVIFGYDCYARLQFTKTAAVAASAAVLLLTWYLEKVLSPDRGSGRILLLAGMLLGIAASLLRFDAFLYGSALMAGVVFYQFTLHLRISNKNPDGQRTRAGNLFLIPRYLVLFTCFFALAFGLRSLDRHEYASSKELSEYQAFNDARSRLLDYGIPDYDAFQERYEALGIDRSAWQLLHEYTFADPDVFTTDVMNEIASWRAEKSLLSLQTLGDFLRAIGKRFSGVSLSCFVIGAWILWAAQGIRGRGTGGKSGRILYLSGGILECILFLGCYYYLYGTGRYLVHRIDVGMYFGLGLGLMAQSILAGSGAPAAFQKATVSNPVTARESEATACFQSKRSSMKSHALPGIICVLAMLAFLLHPQRESFCWRWSREADDWRALTARNLSWVSDAALDKTHLYICKPGTLTDTGSFGLMRTPPKQFFDNLVWLGGWEVYLPSHQQTLEAWDITNPFRDMIGREDVYLVDANVESTLAYLRACYDPEVQAVEVRHNGVFGIYQIFGSRSASNILANASSY